MRNWFKKLLPCSVCWHWHNTVRKEYECHRAKTSSSAEAMAAMYRKYGKKARQLVMHVGRRTAIAGDYSSVKLPKGWHYLLDGGMLMKAVSPHGAVHLVVLDPPQLVPQIPGSDRYDFERAVNL